MTLAQLPYGSDMPLSGLVTSEALITVSLRLRILDWREQGQPHPDWEGGFKAAGLPPWAIIAFDRLLQIVTRAARSPLDVRGFRCPRLGSDEGRFLQILSLFQHCTDGQAEALLENWLSAAPAQLATSPAINLACALQQSGFLIPLRGAAPTVIACQLGAHRGLIRMQ